MLGRAAALVWMVSAESAPPMEDAAKEVQFDKSRPEALPAGANPDLTFARGGRCAL
jgi:hypothetical protein